MRKLLTILLLIHLLFTSFVFHPFTGTKYYVSTTGNNGSAGTSSGTAWATHSYAFSHVSTGDTVYTLNGTHTLTAQLTLPVGITWQGEDSGTAIIKTTIVSDWTQMIVASSAEGTDGNQTIYNLKFDGENNTSSCIYMEGRKNFIIHNCVVQNFKDGGIWFKGRNDNTLAPPSTFATGNEFYNNSLYHCAGYYHPGGGAFGQGCINIGGQLGLLIHDNYFDAKSNYTWVAGVGYPIKYSNDGYNRGVKIYNNTILKFPFGGAYGGDGGWDFSIELYFSQGLEIYNNSIMGGIDLAYDEDKGSYDWIVHIHDNNFYQDSMNTNREGAIWFETGCNGAIVENNVFDKIGKGISLAFENFVYPATTATTYNDFYIQKNLFSNLGIQGDNGNNGKGVEVSADPGAIATLTNFNVLNNTFQTVPGSANIIGVYMNFGNEAGTITTVNIKNNIFENFYLDWFRSDFSTASWDGLALLNNDTYQNGNSDNPAIVTTTPTNYTHTGEIHADPLFVSSSNYHLDTGSPCIDAGINVSISYNGSAPDIGYWESGTPAPTSFRINKKIIKN